MIRFKELISYLPEYERNYEELKQIFLTQQVDILSLHNEIEVISQNQFICSADEIGIKAFEKLLGIPTDIKVDLEVRRKKVLAVWLDSIPYTYKILIKRLNLIFPNGNYYLKEDFNHYELLVFVIGATVSSIKDLEEELDRLLPANLKVDCRNDFFVEDFKKYFVYGVADKSKLNIVPTEVKDEIFEKVISSGLKDYGVVATAKSITIKSELHKKVYLGNSVLFKNYVGKRKKIII